MRSKITNLLRILPGLALALLLMTGVINAQTSPASTSSPEPKKSPEKTKAKTSTETVPTSQTAGEDAGNYTITSSIEFGYRGQRVDGDVNKFKSDLNYKAGPRLFDSSFLAKSKDGKGLFDTMLVTSTGWGADPYGNLRINVENPEWYRFEGTYRRFKYYRYLNNIANPTWLFTPNPTNANPVTGLHGFDTNTQMGDFDLTLFPKDQTLRINFGYSPERYDGPTYTNYHNGGNDFWLLNNAKSRADDYRFGADGKLGPIDWTFFQGFRRFRDDSVINQGIGLNRNVATSVAQLTSFLRQEPTRGSVDYTRGSVHALVGNKFDITGRIVYSRATADSRYLENFTGTNFNFRITTPVWPPTPPAAQPNTTNPSFYNIAGNVKRPNTVGDVGMTYFAGDKFRLSDTFRVEDFTIDGIATFNDFFSITRNITGGTRTDTIGFSDLHSFKTTKYRKYQNTIEGDYQISKNYAFHFGYRYAHRRDEQTLFGYSLNANAPSLLTPEFEEESNTTNAFFGGFKARPSKNLSIFFDAEHGTADNVFTRIGNYNYTNFRAKGRYSPNHRLNFNLATIIRDNANPSEIAGVSLNDFGVSVKTRIFQSSLDWMVNPKLTINTGYNYNWVNSDAVIDYFYQVPPAASVEHPNGHALYYQRINYFYVDLVARLAPRFTLYSSFRINHDGGQGNRLASPAGNPGTLITSYPMSFLSPEARLAIRLNRHLDWNLGYQYYAYNESDFLKTFPGSPRAQNYHAHLPYMSLRVYIGRKE
jgi:hypothetical protein